MPLRAMSGVFFFFPSLSLSTSRQPGLVNDEHVDGASFVFEDAKSYLCVLIEGRYVLRRQLYTLTFLLVVDMRN